MSAAPVNTRVSVEEYLRMNAKPAFEYIDGILFQKPLPTLDHSLVQGQVMELIATGFRAFVAVPELHVQIRPTEYRVPDVATIRKGHLERPYPIKPIYLCVEVVSPDDSVRQLLKKCEEYHKWGVPFCWVLDPQRRNAWEYHAGQEPKRLTAGPITAGEISLDLADIFSVLDET